MRFNGNGEYLDDRFYLILLFLVFFILFCFFFLVIVIEVNLDNQNDSIDIEEGVNLNYSRDNLLDKESSLGDN